MVCQNRKVDQEEWDELWAEVSRWAESGSMIWYGGGRAKNGMSKHKNGSRGVERVLGRGQGDAPDRGSMNWYGGDKELYVKAEKLFKRIGMNYGQRPGRCAESRVDELVWGS